MLHLVERARIAYEAAGEGGELPNRQNPVLDGSHNGIGRNEPEGDRTYSLLAHDLRDGEVPFEQGEPLY